MNILSWARQLPVTSKLSHDAKLRLKRILLRLNLIDRRAENIGLNHIYRDDIFIVSYPKSGNTWLRFLIGNMLEDNELITFRNIENIVPDIYKSRSIINSMSKRPRIIKTHGRQYYDFPRFIYIARDGRDVMVSYYWYKVQNRGFSGTFSEFIRSDHRIMGRWAQHVKEALDYSNKFPNKVLFLRYENLLHDPVSQTIRIAKFCNFTISTSKVEDAVQRASFNNLKHIEKEFGPEVLNTNVKFFREGRSGQWQEMFSHEDLDYFMQDASPILRLLDRLK